MNQSISVAMDVASKAVGLTFAYAAITKLVDVDSFREGIRDYQLIPDGFVRPVVTILIVSESAIAVTHIGNFAQPVAIPFALTLLLVFMVVTAVSLKQGSSKPCLCFGASSGDPLNFRSLFRIGLLLAAELVLFHYAVILGVSTDASATQRSDTLLSLLLSALVLALVGWAFAIPDGWFLLRRHIRCRTRAKLFESGVSGQAASGYESRRFMK